MNCQEAQDLFFPHSFPIWFQKEKKGARERGRDGHNTYRERGEREKEEERESERERGREGERERGREGEREREREREREMEMEMEMEMDGALSTALKTHKLVHDFVSLCFCEGAGGGGEDTNSVHQVYKMVWVAPARARAGASRTAS